MWKYLRNSMIVSFCVGICFWFHCGNQCLHRITKVNETDSMELSISRIPICTSNDRIRHRTLLRTLLTWIQIAEKFHINYWIAYGTLVGYVQRHGLLPHDQDIDILIMSQETVQLVKLAVNLSSGNLAGIDPNLYKLVVHPEWFVADSKYRSYHPQDGINFVAPNARFYHIQSNFHIDIWPMYHYHPGPSHGDSTGSSMLTEYDINYHWQSHPERWTFPLKPCHFSGIKLWCPREPKMIVKAIYGDKSLYASDKSCINGTWM